MNQSTPPSFFRPTQSRAKARNGLNKNRFKGSNCMLYEVPGMWIITRQLTKCEWNSGLASKNTNPLANLASFFPHLTYAFCIFGQLFSDLASDNTELLASLASVLKNLFTLLEVHCPITVRHLTFRKTRSIGLY
jgi:hypothetical protein